MIQHRPVPVGGYEILQDFECPDASVRILRLGPAEGAVEQHTHHRSMQIYVVLDGAADVTVDGEQMRLGKDDATAVWQGRVHGAAAAGAGAVLMNISIPPLSADDQLPVEVPAEPPDFRLPHPGDDIED